MEITKKIYSEISAGELFDKISILEIKKNKIKDKTKRNIVLKELSSLQVTVNENIEKSKWNGISDLKSPTISTLFPRPSEGVDKCDFRVLPGGGKKLMAFQTTKGVTAATHTP